MAPFMDRCVGPTWFRNKFPGVTPHAVAMLNSVWATFLTPTPYPLLSRQGLLALDLSVTNLI